MTYPQLRYYTHQGDPPQIGRRRFANLQEMQAWRAANAKGD